MKVSKKFSICGIGLISLCLSGCISSDKSPYELEREKERETLQTYINAMKTEKSLVNVLRFVYYTDFEIIGKGYNLCGEYDWPSYMPEDGRLADKIEARFIETPYTAFYTLPSSPNPILQLIAQELFDKPVTDYEQNMMGYCFVNGLSRYKFSTDTDGCYAFLFQYQDKPCRFDWQKYLPDDIKISSYLNLNRLARAWHSSIEECQEKFKDMKACDFINGERVCQETDEYRVAMSKCEKQANELATKLACSGNL